MWKHLMENRCHFGLFIWNKKRLSQVTFRWRALYPFPVSFSTSASVCKCVCVWGGREGIIKSRGLFSKVKRDSSLISSSSRLVVIVRFSNQSVDMSQPKILDQKLAALAAHWQPTRGVAPSLGPYEPSAPPPFFFKKKSSVSVSTVEIVPTTCVVESKNSAEMARQRNVIALSKQTAPALPSL